MNRTMLMILTLVSATAFGCSSTNSNANVSLKNTNSNTGYIAPTNVTPGPAATTTPANPTRIEPPNMNAQSNSNVSKSNGNAVSNRLTNNNKKP